MKKDIEEIVVPQPQKVEVVEVVEVPTSVIKTEELTTTNKSTRDSILLGSIADKICEILRNDKDYELEESQYDDFRQNVYLGLLTGDKTKCQGTKKDGSPCNIGGQFLIQGYCTHHFKGDRSEIIKNKELKKQKSTEKKETHQCEASVQSKKGARCISTIGITEIDGHYLCTSHRKSNNLKIFVEPTQSTQ